MRRITFIASRILCVLGLLIIFSALLNYLVLGLPPKPDSAQWRLTVFGQLVSRSGVPFVGIIFLLAGSWVGELRSSRRITRLPKMRLLSLVFTCLLSLMFFLLIPPYISAVRTTQQVKINAVEDEATQAEKSLEDALAEQIQQERSRIQVLLQDEAMLDQAIASGEIQDTQIVLLQRFRDDLNALERYLNDRAKADQKAPKAEIQQQRQEAIRAVETSGRKAIIRVSGRSFRSATSYACLAGLSLVNPNILRSQSPRVQRK